MNDLAFHFYDLHPPDNVLQDEVLWGLSRRPRRLSPKFFYDHRGSALFEAITHTPEYYLTHIELGLFEAHRKEMASLLGRHGLLMELGSGSGRKIRLLLDELRPAVYMPVDICREFLLQAAGELAVDFPEMAVHAVCADFSAGLELPWRPPDLLRAAFFPGSSIGNFEPPQVRRLLQHVAHALGPGGHLLIGVDLQKDPAMLQAAYNDAAGLTARFNLNLLARINRELDADFDLDAFHHRAFYNRTAGRVEMHLISDRPQTVEVCGTVFRFAPGEGIHTENSYKYTIGGFHQLVGSAGYEPVQVWQDSDSLYSVHCLRVVG